MKTILLVPDAVWWDRLLADGPCGARVPKLFRKGGPWCQYHETSGSGHDEALVLAFKGVRVHEGHDRLHHVAKTHHIDLEWTWDGHRRVWFDLRREPEDGSLRDSKGPGVVAPPEIPDDLVPTWATAIQAAARGLGTVVVQE